MIFAFDLDRTMIFSNKAMLEFNIKDKVECIEYRDKSGVISEVSYISDGVLKALSEIRSKGCVLIPTTTRSLEQFRRINYFKDLSWYITSNGGRIFHNGKILEPWEDIIHNLVVEAMPIYENVIKELDKLKYTLHDAKIVDGMFVYTITEDVEKTASFLNIFLKNTSCDFTIQGKKVYVMHKGISKEGALNYVKGIIQDKEIWAVGDGKLDKGMVLTAEHGFVPEHGEIINFLSDDEKKSVQVVSKGFQGVLEILNKIKVYT